MCDCPLDLHAQLPQKHTTLRDSHMKKASWLENSWHGCSISICSHTEYAYTLGAGAHIHFSNWRPWCEPKEEKTNAAKKGFRSNSVSKDESAGLYSCAFYQCTSFSSIKYAKSCGFLVFFFMPLHPSKIYNL